MVRELIDYFLTPTSKEAKSSGALYESIALQARARRQWGAWQEHLQNCHKLTEEFVKSVRPRRIAFLGSGPLFDVWPEVFNAGLEMIFLVDIVHPREVQRRFRSGSGSHVSLVEWDLAKPWKARDIGLDIDAVISCNVMSQLGLPFRDDAMTERLAREHFATMKDVGLPTLIWSDVERLERDEDGRVLVKTPTLGNFSPDHRPVGTWFWQLAPRGEIARDLSVDLRVHAWSW